jgi:hypothetical protein
VSSPDVLLKLFEDGSRISLKEDGPAIYELIRENGGWPWLLKQTKAQVAAVSPKGTTAMLFVKIMETSIAHAHGDGKIFVFNDVSNDDAVSKSKRGHSNKPVFPLSSELIEQGAQFNVRSSHKLTPETEGLRGYFSEHRPMDPGQKSKVIYREFSHLVGDTGTELTTQQREDLGAMLEEVIPSCFLIGRTQVAEPMTWCALPISAVACLRLPALPHVPVPPLPPPLSPSLMCQSPPSPPPSPPPQQGEVHRALQGHPGQGRQDQSPEPHPLRSSRGHIRQGAQGCEDPHCFAWPGELGPARVVSVSADV